MSVTAVSVELPDDLAQASLEIARGLGLSRSELIRQALEHEISQALAIGERLRIAQALSAMTTDPLAAALADELDNGLVDALPVEREGWWKG